MFPLFLHLKKRYSLYRTPAGVGKISPGDKLEGYLESEHVFSIDIK